MQKIHVEYFMLVLALFCAGCGNGSGSAGAPPGRYVGVYTNFSGQEITSIETNTWEFAGDGRFLWADRAIMPLKGTYRVEGRRVLLSYDDIEGKPIKDDWYFNVTPVGLDGHNRTGEGDTGEHLVKIR